MLGTGTQDEARSVVCEYVPNLSRVTNPRPGGIISIPLSREELAQFARAELRKSVFTWYG